MFYPESVIEITFLERNVRNMCAEGKNAGHVLFNCTIYLVRQKRPFSGSVERFKFFLAARKEFYYRNLKKCHWNDRAAGNFLDAISKVTIDSLEKDLAKAHNFCMVSSSCLFFFKSSKPVLEI